MHSHSWPWTLIFLELVKLLKAFGILPGAVAAVGVQRLYQRRRQRKAMEGWPATDATIQSGNVRKQGISSYWVEVTYTYYVGEYRSGKYFRRFRREEQADAFVREVKDKRVHVHYDSASPEKSVILDRDVEMIAMLAPSFIGSGEGL
jgi:hypothetical protein